MHLAPAESVGDAIALAAAHECTAVETAEGIGALEIASVREQLQVKRADPYLVNLVAVVNVEPVVNLAATFLGEVVKLTAAILALAVVPGDGTGFGFLG